MSPTQSTTNRDQIKAWIENHKGKPVLFDHPNAEADKKGIRIEFPGKDDEAMLNNSVASEPISWDDFFQLLEERKLVFVYEADVQPGDDLTMAYRFEPQPE